MNPDWRRMLPLGAAVAVALLGAGLIALLPPGAAPWREPALDRLVLLTPPPEGVQIAVVDIGAGTPDGALWTRGHTARLLEAIGAAGAAGVALDIVLGANCGPSPDNDALAAAIAKLPTTLGFLLSGADGRPHPAPTVAASQGLALPAIWQAPGAEHACASFERVARGSGVASLAGGADAIVRDAPALAVAGGTAYLGLAVEAVRLQAGLGSVIIGGDPAWLRLGGSQLDIGPAASLRFRPSAPEIVAQRTLSAADIMEGGVPADALARKIVFIGNGDPGAGALRATAASPLYPSVQIHADLAAGLLTQTLPQRPGWTLAAESWSALAGGAITGVLGALFSPLLAGLGIAAIAAFWIAGAAGAALFGNLLVDPAGPPLVMVLAGLAAVLAQAAHTRRAESALRRRIGQLLPPDVVARFVREPGLLRLEGEEREVTALFTDIEGFSQTLHGIEPRRFVRVLDAYFTGMSRIVLAHGGMIDKLVGDAIHALFNAPTDLEHHVDKAIACARDMQLFAEAFRQQPDMVEIRFGRTRIGIETGLAILGDVGAADKIDYTAHGPAINLAARLEEANKGLGTAICIGPAAAAKSSMALRPLGEIDIRGFGPTRVHTLPDA